MKSNFKYTVDVIMLTYQHEKFIIDAIKGVISQRTDFDFRLLIFDDASTDKTNEVILSVENTNSRLLIDYRRNSKNLGPLKNGQNALKTSDSFYIALCEGDDYWTDPHKLQKQVDFLEANEEFVLSFHDVSIIEDEKIIADSYLSKESRIDLNDFEMVKNLKYVPTLSWCFRNILTKIPKEMEQAELGDMFLLSLLGNYGKAKYQTEIEVGGVHRFHSGGVWSKKSLCRKHEMARNLYKSLEYYYSSVKKMAICEFYRDKKNENNTKLLYYGIQEKNNRIVRQAFVYCLWENKFILKRQKLILLIKTVLKYLLTK